MIRKILLGLLAALILIQFIRPDKNDSDDQTHAISTKYTVPVHVNDILRTSCNDCHSNKTVYPWYARIQPVAWWLDHHITDGKRHFNLSDFTQLPIAVQNHKFEEMVEMVEKHEMPLPSYHYLGLHSEAVLSDEQRQMLMEWARLQMNVLKDTYPPDSLVMKRRGSPPPSAK